MGWKESQVYINKLFFSLLGGSKCGDALTSVPTEINSPFKDDLGKQKSRICVYFGEKANKKDGLEFQGNFQQNFWGWFPFSSQPASVTAYPSLASLNCGLLIKWGLSEETPIHCWGPGGSLQIQPCRLTASTWNPSLNLSVLNTTMSKNPEQRNNTCLCWIYF